MDRTLRRRHVARVEWIPHSPDAGAEGFHPGDGQSASPCRNAYAVAADLDETASLPKMLLR